MNGSQVVGLRILVRSLGLLLAQAVLYSLSLLGALSGIGRILIFGWIPIFSHLSDKRLHSVTSILPSSDSSSTLSLGFYQPLFDREAGEMVSSSQLFMTRILILGEGITNLGF